MHSIETYITTSADFLNVEQALSVSVGRSLFDVAENAKQSLEKLREDKPRFCDEDFKKDIKYISGQISILNWFLDLPGKAKEFNQKQEGS